VSGSNVVFTVHGAPSMSVGSSLSLSVPLEILGSTGVNDSSGNPWDLVASGQVDKSYVLSSGDQVTVNYNETVTVASSYSLTLTEGSGSAVIDQGDSSVSGSGTATLIFTLTGSPSGSVAADGPVVSASTGITATPSPTVTSDSVSIDLSTTCSTIAGYTRVFGGSNCNIWFGSGEGLRSRSAGFERLSWCVCVGTARVGTHRGVIWCRVWGFTTSRSISGPRTRLCTSAVGESLPQSPPWSPPTR
jgi:hypothetical protein